MKKPDQENQQGIVAELEARNEELQSANKALHSVNEKLSAANREYEEKILQQTQLAEDMDNLLSSPVIGTIFLDKKLKVRTFAPAAARQFSLLAEDIGRPIIQLSRKIVFDDFQDELKKVLESEEHASFEVKNDDEQYFLMELIPYRTEKNEVTGVVITFIDVTHVKEASKIIEQSNEDLQAFAYAISHDLNEPTRMLTSFSKLLVANYESADKERIKEYIDLIEDNAQRLNGMLSGTLEFSRVITQGSSFVDTDLLEVLRMAKSDLSGKIEQAEVLIECEYLPMVYVDPKQMARAFKEVIGNAIKFCRPGEVPKIEISATQKEQNHYISFSDNGIGVPVNFRDKLFAMFSTANSRGEYEGMGIGLAIARRILERHNGNVMHASNADGGSIFTIMIPEPGDS